MYIQWYPKLTFFFYLVFFAEIAISGTDSESEALHSVYSFVFSQAFHPESLSVVAKAVNQPKNNEILFLSSVFHLQQAVRAQDNVTRSHHFKTALNLHKKMQENQSSYFLDLAKLIAIHKVGKSNTALAMFVKDKSFKDYGLAYYVSMYLILSDLAPLDDARQEVARIFEKNGEKNRDKLTLKRVEDVCEAIKDKVEITKSQFQAIIFANRDNKEFLKDFADRFRNESSANKKQYYRLLVDLLRVRGTPPLYEFAGDLAFHNTNYNSALVHYKNSLSLSDRNGVVLHKMGIAHLENKKPLMAQKYLAAALLLRSDDSSIKYNMARALTLQGKLSDAESVIRQAWTDWPASRELYQSDPDFNKLRKYLHNQFVSH